MTELLDPSEIRQIAKEEYRQRIAERTVTQPRRTITYPEMYAPVTGEVDVEAQRKIEEATGVSVEPEYETRVVGTTEEGRPIVQQIPLETRVIGPIREQLYGMQPRPISETRTLTETIYPYSPELAGFVGSYEAWLRPEVPTVSGAGMEFVTVRGYPAFEFIPEYMRVPKEPKHVPYTVPPKDPFKELKKLGPRYVVGGLLGEVSQAYLMYKAGQKLFPSQKKVVSETTQDRKSVV